MTLFETATISSPIGVIRVITRDDTVYSLDFEEYEERMLALLHKRYGQVELEQQPATNLTKQLDAYFSGEITALSTIKTALKGTEFQQNVWAALQEIPAGTTCSYATIATKLGTPKAVRAVGMANSLNPIAIIVPCHRVIAASGSLSGYAGGIERKRWLIAHEAAHSPSFE